MRRLAKSWLISQAMPGQRAVFHSLPMARTLAVAASNGWIRFWDVAEKKVKRKLQAHKDSIYGIAWSSTGQYLATCGGDRQVKVWDLKTYKLLHSFQHTSIAMRARFISKDRWLIHSGWDQAVPFRDAKTGSLRSYVKMFVNRMDCSSDGTLLATSHTLAGELHLYTLRWRDPTAAEKKQIQTYVKQWEDDSYAVREEASRKLIALGQLASGALQPLVQSDSAEIRIRARKALEQIRSPEPRLVLRGHSNRVDAIQLSPDAKTLASGGWDGEVRLWNVKTGKSVALFKRKSE